MCMSSTVTDISWPGIPLSLCRVCLLILNKNGPTFPEISGEESQNYLDVVECLDVKILLRMQKFHIKEQDLV